MYYFFKNLLLLAGVAGLLNLSACSDSDVPAPDAQVEESSVATNKEADGEQNARSSILKRSKGSSLTVGETLYAGDFIKSGNNVLVMRDNGDLHLFKVDGNLNIQGGLVMGSCYGRGVAGTYAYIAGDGKLKIGRGETTYWSKSASSGITSIIPGNAGVLATTRSGQIKAFIPGPGKCWGN